MERIDHLLIVSSCLNENHSQTLQKTRVFDVGPEIILFQISYQKRTVLARHIFGEWELSTESNPSESDDHPFEHFSAAYV